MARQDLYRLSTFGSDIYGMEGEYTNILFTSDAFGRLLTAEAFPGNMNEYQCLRHSWLYRMIGAYAPQPAVLNRVPLILCRDKRNCKVPTPIAAFTLSDNNGDFACEMFLGDVPEPHFITPFPRIWDYYRSILSGTAHAFNVNLHNSRVSIEKIMSNLCSKFPVLNNPNPHFERTTNLDYASYNELLEALVAVHNEGITENSPTYRAASPSNQILFTAATAHGAHRLNNLAYNHICDCEMHVNTPLPPSIWYPLRTLEIAEFFRAGNPILQSIRSVYTRGLRMLTNTRPIGPNEEQVAQSVRIRALNTRLSDLEAENARLRAINGRQRGRIARLRAMNGQRRGIISRLQMAVRRARRLFP